MARKELNTANPSLSGSRMDINSESSSGDGGMSSALCEIYVNSKFDCLGYFRVHHHRGAEGRIGSCGHLHHSSSNISSGYNTLLLAFLFMGK